MPKISDRELVRVCHRLFADDYEILKDMAREAGDGNTNRIIREIIATFVRQTKNLERQKFDQTGKLELPLCPEQ